MLSCGVGQPNISNEFDVRQPPNPLILALAWVFVLLVLGCFCVFSSDLVTRAIGAVLLIASVFSFAVFQYMRRHGYPRKKYEPLPPFEFAWRWPTREDWTRLDRVGKVAVAVVVACLVIILVLLIYLVWVTSGS